MLGLTSSGVCSLGMSGAVFFVVCANGLSNEQRPSLVAAAGESSCNSPRLSKTLG